MSAWLLDPFFDWLIARLNRPRPLGLRWVFTLSPTTLNEGNDMGILRVGVPKKISLIVRNKDGSAGLIDGLPAWTNETPDFIDMTVADDGLSATIADKGATDQKAKVSVLADARFGPAVRNITAFMEYDITEEADRLELVDEDIEPAVDADADPDTTADPNPAP